MISRIRSPKGIFGQNMSDLLNGSLTGVSRTNEHLVINFLNNNLTTPRK